MILDIVATLITAITAMHGSPEVLVEEGNYSRIRMADSCYVEVLNYGDSSLVVETVCAPICSSCARVYNKESELFRTIPSPYPAAVFPMAYIEDGQLRWIDNTAELLDEQEKR